MFITGLLIYFALLVLMGFYLSRRNVDFDAYFFGKRRLGSFLIFFTVTASWFGAASTIATVDAAYKNGFNAVWLLGMPTFATIIAFIFINRRIRETRFVSLPILLEKYYGKSVSAAASFLIFLYMVLLAASQLVAWGKFVSGIIGQSYEVTVIIGALAVILYSFLGGYLSIVLTDGLQFILLTAGLIYMVIFFNDSPLQIKYSDYDFFSNSSFNLLMTASFTMAWLISPIIWQRIASARSARASARGLILSITAFAILYHLVMVVGIGLRSLPGKFQGDLLGGTVQHWLPPAGGLLVFLGIAAAIMSTMDTAINVGALTLVKDVFQVKIKQVKHKKKMIYSAQLATFLCGALAIVVALRFNSIIKTLGLASEIMAEGLFIPGMYLLFFKKKKPTAALLSLLLGGGFSIIVFFNAYAPVLPLPEWPYSVPYGIGLSLLGFITGYFIDGRRQKS